MPEGLSEVNVAPLDGGVTNENFVVNTNNESFFMKVFGRVLKALLIAIVPTVSCSG